MFDYLQQFKSLPLDLRDKVSSPLVMALISELETKHQVDLATTVMKVMTKSVDIRRLNLYLAEEFGLEAGKADVLAGEMKEKIFFIVADYLGLRNERRAWDLNQDIEKIIAASGLTIASSLLVSRFKNILATYLRGVRDKIDTKNSLAKDVKIGGLNLSPEEIERVMKVCATNKISGLSTDLSGGAAISAQAPSSASWFNNNASDGLESSFVAGRPRNLTDSLSRSSVSQSATSTRLDRIIAGADQSGAYDLKKELASGRLASGPQSGSDSAKDIRLPDTGHELSSPERSDDAHKISAPVEHLDLPAPTDKLMLGSSQSVLSPKDKAVSATDRVAPSPKDKAASVTDQLRASALSPLSPKEPKVFKKSPDSRVSGPLPQGPVVVEKEMSQISQPSKRKKSFFSFLSFKTRGKDLKPAVNNLKASHSAISTSASVSQSARVSSSALKSGLSTASALTSSSLSSSSRPSSIPSSSASASVPSPTPTKTSAPVLTAALVSSPSQSPSSAPIKTSIPIPSTASKPFATLTSTPTQIPPVTSLAPASRPAPALQRPAAPTSSSRPQIHDIKPMPKVMGPLEELQFLDPLNFRRLSSDPVLAVNKIFGKIKLLEKDGYDKMVLGVKAWRQSPINRLYVQLGQEAVVSGKTLAEILQKQEKNSPRYLSMEEFLAISGLNSKLIF